MIPAVSNPAGNSSSISRPNLVRRRLGASTLLVTTLASTLLTTTSASTTTSAPAPLEERHVTHGAVIDSQPRASLIQQAVPEKLVLARDLEKIPQRERHLVLARECQQKIRPQTYEGSHEVAMMRVDLLRVNEDVKQKLRDTCGVLPTPTVVWDSPDNPTFIVWRGTGFEQLEDIITLGSIYQPADPNTPCPTEEAAQIQVAEEGRIPEFTFNPAIAQQFSRKGKIMVCVAIQSQYLTLGSIGESGVVCNYGAPMKIIAWASTGF